MAIKLPAMLLEQEESWRAIFEIYDVLPRTTSTPSPQPSSSWASLRQGNHSRVTSTGGCETKQ